MRKEIADVQHKKLALIEKARSPEYRSSRQSSTPWLDELIDDARRLPQEDTIEVYEVALRRLYGGGV